MPLVKTTHVRFDPLTSEPFHKPAFEIGGNVAGKLAAFFAELNSQGLTIHSVSALFLEQYQRITG